MASASGFQVLIFEDTVGPLALCALSLARRGFPVSYAPDGAEARLMAAEAATTIRVLTFSPSVTDAELGSILNALPRPPALIVAGENPGSRRRAELSAMGISLCIWSSDLESRLGTALSVALDLTDIAPVILPFVASEQAVTIIGQSEPRRWEATLCVLAGTGAYLSTARPTEKGETLVVQFSRNQHDYALTGTVAIVESRSEAFLDRWPDGVGVKFDKISKTDLQALNELIASDQDIFEE